MISAIASFLAAAAASISLVLGTCQTMLPDRPTAAGYDWSQPVPESAQRGDSWLDGSAVIGHSLMEGFERFADVEADIHYFTTTGLSAAGATSYGGFDLPDGGTGTLEAGLSQRRFSKIYIMLGVNEIATSKDNFKKNMTAVIQTIRASQPQGIPIYILELTPTTRERSASSVFDRDNVRRLNEALAELCEEQQCYRIDLFACFADEEGYLPAPLSTDGLHLTAPQYRIMADYILSHTVKEHGGVKERGG